MGIALALASLYALLEPFDMIGVYGFYGGHGTAAAVGTAWESYGGERACHFVWLQQLLE
jgi:Na+/glutamate symporter